MILYKGLLVICIVVEVEVHGRACVWLSAWSYRCEIATKCRCPLETMEMAYGSTWHRWKLVSVITSKSEIAEFSWMWENWTKQPQKKKLFLTIWTIFGEYVIKISQNSFYKVLFFQFHNFNNYYVYSTLNIQFWNY